MDASNAEDPTQDNSTQSDEEDREPFVLSDTFSIRSFRSFKIGRSERSERSEKSERVARPAVMVHPQHNLNCERQ